MPVTDSDQRRHTRHTLSHPLVVIDSATEERIGTLVNLSFEGLMLIGSKEVNDGSVYQCHILLNPDASHTTALNFGIECLWTDEADSEGKYWSGYRIIDLSEENKTVLTNLITQLQ